MPDAPNTQHQGAGSGAPEVVAKRMSELESEIHGDSLVIDDGGKAPAEEVHTTDESDGQVADQNTTDQDDGNAEGEGEPVELEISEEDIEVTKDGKFVFKVDPNDPNSNFYTGKDLKELLSNIRNGILEKDRTIHRSRSESKLNPAEETIRKVIRGPQAEESESDGDIPPPDENAIRDRICKQHRVDPAVLEWGRNEWVNYFEKNNIPPFEQNRIIQNVDNIRKEVSDSTSTEHIGYINGTILMDEVRQVQGLLDESNLKADDFDIEGIFDRIRSDPKNYEPGGRLKHGVLVAQASREIMRLSKSQTTSKVRQEINRTILDGDDAKRNIAGSGGGGTNRGGAGKSASPKSNVPKTSEDALKQILREVKAGQRKNG